ncbi:uncharacterized protein LOC106507571 [Sus scrofa]|uniref:uncharacterized protein LOC106507571 n=1 Tax=Sus scrofa TaxID=9823 RepID=UPI000A2B0D5F|nr:uncharacterized protein LOC106507571 [Sus scrofa]
MNKQMHNGWGESAGSQSLPLVSKPLAHGSARHRALGFSRSARLRAGAAGGAGPSRHHAPTPASPRDSRRSGIPESEVAATSASLAPDERVETRKLYALLSITQLDTSFRQAKYIISPIHSCTLSSIKYCARHMVFSGSRQPAPASLQVNRPPFQGGPSLRTCSHSPDQRRGHAGTCWLLIRVTLIAKQLNKQSPAPRSEHEAGSNTPSILRSRGINGSTSMFWMVLERRATFPTHDCLDEPPNAGMF